MSQKKPASLNPIHGSTDADADANTPTRPERSKRHHSQVSPTSSADLSGMSTTDLSSLTEDRMKELLVEALIPIHQRLDIIQETPSVFEEESEYFHGAIAKISEQQNAMIERIENLELENKTLKKKVITLESHSRRSNLRFYGLPENRSENPELQVIQYLNEHEINMSPTTIERAHRLGQFHMGKIRPIIVKFWHYKDREVVWHNLGHRLIPPPQSRPHVREDFPEEIETARSKLIPIAHAATQYRDTATKSAPSVKLVTDQLFINKQKFTTENLHTLPEKLQPHNIFTPMKDNAVAFFTSNSPLSNHHPAPFKYNRETFNCGEQFIMCEKARFANDQESVIAIMKASNPVEQKAIGRRIRNLDINNWRQHAQEILLPGLTAKFEQNKHCLQLLLATDQRYIIEANQNDLFFGAGVSLFSR